MKQKTQKNKIFIASDHGGYKLKNNLLNILSNYKIIDLGPYAFDPQDDYPDYALKLATEVSKENNSIGILICRSGNGMVIAANKVRGAYAALCLTAKQAKMARLDDNANIICLSADYEIEPFTEIVKTFLNNNFSNEDRHLRRFLKVQNIENTTMDKTLEKNLI